MNIAVIGGDGTGPEVAAEGVKVLKAVAKLEGFDKDLKLTDLDWGGDRYLKTGEALPADGLDQLRKFDCILLGAVGHPDVQPGILERKLLLDLRFGLDQYINLRPVKLFPGVECPIKGKTPEDIDFVVVRENTEGEYSSVGGRVFEGTERETVLQETVMTRVGVDRVLRYAFEQARRRPARHLTSATKSNGISITMPYWDERVDAIGEEYPDVRHDRMHIDALAASFVLRPDRFDVVVGSNLFGDILSDLGPACTGTLGIAPSANLNPDRTHPSLFEPVHGSAPDIAGKGIADPIGQIWCGAMMLDHLGHEDAGRHLLAAIEDVLAAGPDQAPLTPDLQGTGTTAELGEVIAERVRERAG
jgi:tartrate dehydrogenase/decarboxylase/D-malate dehydrogenase